MRHLYSIYKPNEKRTKAVGAYINVIDDIEATFFGSFTTLVEILLFFGKIMQLFSAILDHYFHESAFPSKLATVLNAIRKLLTSLISSFKARGRGFLLIHETKKILERYMSKELRKTPINELARLHFKFYNEFMFVIMQKLSNSEVLLVVSSFTGCKTDKLCYECGIFRPSTDDKSLVERELWEIEILSDQMVLRRNKEEYQDERDLKDYMKSLVTLMNSKVTFENADVIARVAELYTMLAIYMFYKNYVKISFLSDCFNELKSVFSRIYDEISIPVCMTKLTSLTKKFLVRCDSFRLVMEGEEVARDCRDCLHFLLSKYEKYLELMLFFRYHKPTMLHSSSSETVLFEFLMESTFPRKSEDWQVKMTRNNSPMTVDFDPLKKSCLQKCSDSTVKKNGHLFLFKSLSEFYLKRIESESTKAVNFYSFQSCVKMILVSKIWQMSEAQDQAEVDALAQQFLQVILFLNELVLKYENTTMSSDAFKKLVNEANKFYSAQMQHLRASKYNASWTQMASELCDCLTVQGSSTMSTREYMIKKGILVHVDDETGAKSYLFSFRSGTEIYQVRCKVDANGIVKTEKSKNEQEIVKILTEQLDGMNINQMLTSLLFVKLYRLKDAKKISENILARLATYGDGWKRAGEEIVACLDTINASTFSTVVTLISRYNLNLKADSQLSATDFSSFLSSRSVKIDTQETTVTWTSKTEEVTTKVVRQVIVVEEEEEEEDEEESEGEEVQEEEEEWEKWELVKISNNMQHNADQIIVFWTAELTYKDGRSRVITFKRNSARFWEASIINSRGTTVVLSAKRVKVLYDEITEYSKNARTLDVDPLRELLFISTIVIVILNQHRIVVPSYKMRLELQSQNNANNYSLHHNGNFLHHVTKYLRENKKLTQLIHRIEKLDFAYPADIIIAEIIIILSEFKLKETTFEWTVNDNSIRMTFESGDQFIHLRTANVTESGVTSSLNCSDSHLAKTIEACVTAIFQMASIPGPPALDIMTNVMTALFFLYKVVQCDMRIKDEKQVELHKTIFMCIMNSCSLLFPQMIKTDFEVFIKKIISMFEMVTSTVTFESQLQQMLVYVKQQLTNIRELRALRLGIQPIYMVQGPTYETSAFYMDEGLTQLITVNYLRSTLLKNYLEYVETAEDFDLPNLITSLEFLLLFSAKLVANGENIDFMMVFISTLFVTFKRKFPDYEGEICGIEKWMIDILTAIKSGEYKNLSFKEVFQKVTTQSHEIFVSILKVIKIKLEYQKLIEKQKQALVQVDFLFGSIFYCMQVEEGVNVPEFNNGNFVLNSKASLEQMMESFLANPCTQAACTTQMRLAKVLFFIVSLQRSILIAEGTTVDEDAWLLFLERLKMIFGQKLSGNFAFINYLKEVFFGQIVASMKLLFDYAKREDKAIEESNTGSSSGFVKINTTDMMNEMRRRHHACYIFCQNTVDNVSTVQVRKKAENDKNEVTLNSAGIKTEAELQLNELTRLTISHLGIVKRLLETMLSLLIALMVIEAKNPQKAELLKPFSEKLETLRCEKGKIWPDIVTAVLDRAAEALQKLPTIKVEGMIQEIAKQLLDGQ